MKPLERFLIELDSGPWSAVWRVALGLSILPVFRAVSVGHDSVWIALASFIALLVALRVVPAVVRRVVPFSVDAQKIWKERRYIAKRHDSLPMAETVLDWSRHAGLCRYRRWSGHRRTCGHIILFDRRQRWIFCLAQRRCSRGAPAMRRSIRKLSQMWLAVTNSCAPALAEIRC